MNVLANPIIAQVISICVAGICGWLAAQVRDMRKKDEALHDGMKVLLRAQILDAYDAYVVQGDKLSFERKEEIELAYRAYVALGGNGVVTKIHEAVMALPVETIH